MPLIKSGSKDAVSENIRREMGEGGKPKAQAVAIALSVKRKYGVVDPQKRRKPYGEK